MKKLILILAIVAVTLSGLCQTTTNTVKSLFDMTNFPTLGSNNTFWVPTPSVNANITYGQLLAQLQALWQYDASNSAWMATNGFVGSGLTGQQTTNAAAYQAKLATNSLGSAAFTASSAYDVAGAAHDSTNTYPWSALYDSAGTALGATNGLGSAAWHLVTDFDLSGTATGATNGLGSAAFTSKTAYDAAGVATASTNGLGSAAFTATSAYDAAGKAHDATNTYPWGSLYDPAGAALGATNGLGSAAWHSTGDFYLAANPAAYISLVQAEVLTNNLVTTNLLLSTSNALQVLINGSVSGVSSFNTRTGAVSLTSGDVTTALGFTPLTGLQVSNSYVSYATNAGTAATASAGWPTTWDWTAAITGKPAFATNTYVGLSNAVGFIIATNGGPVADGQLSSNVALDNAQNNLSGSNYFAGNVTFSGGSSVTALGFFTGNLIGNADSATTNVGALSAYQLTSGTLPDARLSANVPVMNGTNHFSGTNLFNQMVLTNPLSVTAVAMVAMDASGRLGTNALPTLSSGAPLNGTNNWTGTNAYSAPTIFSNTVTFQGTSPGSLGLNNAGVQVILLNATNGSMTVTGVVSAASYSGIGSSLTALTPANISSGTAGISITGNAATASAATSATNLYAGTVVLTNSPIELSAQKYSTNTTAQILVIDLSLRRGFIQQTNSMTFTNVLNVPMAYFGNGVQRTIRGSGSTLTVPSGWHGFGSYSTNGVTLTNNVYWTFALDCDYVVSSNYYKWAVVPANN